LSIRPSPRISSGLETSASGVLPLSLCRQAETIDKVTPLLFFFDPSILVQRSPRTKCLGLLPVYTHYRILAVSLVPEIIVVHRLVIRIGKVFNPSRSIGIHRYLFVFDEITALAYF